MLVANLSSNNVSAYSIQTNGALKAVGGSLFGAGSQPYAVTVDPSGAFAYVPNNGTNNVSAYTIDGTSGVLTQVAELPFRAGTNTDGIAVDPSSAFAYAANDGSNNVWRFPSTLRAARSRSSPDHRSVRQRTV